MTRHLRILLLPALFLCFLPFAPRDGGLFRLVPDFPPRLWSALTTGDDSTLVRTVRDLGFPTAARAWGELKDALYFREPADYALHRRVFLTPLRRFTDAFEGEFGNEAPRIEMEYLESLDPAGLRAAQEAWTYFEPYRARFGLYRADLDSLHREVGRRLEDLPYGQRTIWMDREAERIYRDGRRDDAIALWERAAALADSVHATALYCQILGVLGEVYGDEDEAKLREYWQRGLDAALDARHPVQAARFMSFFASYHLNRGHFSTAADLTARASRLCRDFGGGPAEVRFLLRAARLNQVLGFDEEAERLLERTEVVMRSGSHMEEWGMHEEVRLGLTWAALRLDQGRTKEARGALARIPGQRNESEENMVRLLEARADLLDGDARGALARLAPVLRDYDQRPDWSIGESIPLLAGEIHHALGDDETAAGHLALAEEELLDGTTYSWIRLLPRLTLLKAGIEEGEEGTAFLGHALERMDRALADLEPTVSAYAVLTHFDLLRDRAANRLAGDPVLSYEFEMAWRDLPRGFGPRRDPSILPRLVSILVDERPPPDPVAARIPPGATHVLYRIARQGTVRWTATAAGIVREELGPPPGERLGAVLERLHTPPPADRPGIPASLAASLRDLGRDLLPGLPPGSPLYVTPDGPLLALPFETLDVQGDDAPYRPLFADHDVILLRAAALPSGKSATGTDLVVGNPELSPRARRMFGILPPLPGAEREGRRAAEHLPGAVFLEGPEATRERVMNAWGSAPRIYFATHVVRGDEATGFSFLPLATVTEAAESPEGIGVEDVRRTDLRGARLVVLSGCGTGFTRSPSSGGIPSLADAFLDAGARWTVSTLWALPDEGPREEDAWMRALLDEDAFDPGDLQAWRLAVARDGEGWRHPFSWAVYAIATTGFAPPEPDEEVARPVDE